MNNLIQSGMKEKISMRMEGRASHLHLYGYKSSSEKFVFDVPLMVNEALLRQPASHAFAIAANAIREEEKARLARELHDELAQSLTVLKMDALWVRDNAAGGLERIGGKLSTMMALLDTTLATTRRIASDLRPMLLDDLGLIPAIEWLISSYIQRCGVPCSLCVNDGTNLEQELQEPYATAVFRIVQESLANVAKHAAASQVEVALNRVGGEILLVIQDNGCGFLTTASRKTESLGLLGLRERVQMLDGHILINSVLGKGTRIEIRIPIKPTWAT